MVGDLCDPPVAYLVTQQFMFVFEKRPGFKLYVFKVGQTNFSNEKWFFSYLNELLFM